jgi:hypothetical protein
MAVERIGKPIHEYTALSSDTLPTEDVPNGSRAWVLTAGSPPTVALWVLQGGTWGVVE